MWKWLILAAAAYALYRLFANDLLKKKKAGEAEDAADLERKVAAGEMVRDPECGTYVAVDSAISVRDGETVHYFCSFFNRFSSIWAAIPVNSPAMTAAMMR